MPFDIETLFPELLCSFVRRCAPPCVYAITVVEQIILAASERALLSLVFCVVLLVLADLRP